MVSRLSTPRGIVSTQRGASLIEVLVTVVIILLGLLGLAGLHSRLQSAEMESYQRSQALMLLDDMSNRLSINRGAAPAYATGAPVATPLGAGIVCPTAVATVADRDLADWCALLQGASETTGAGANRVGAVIGGRGCIETVDAGTRVYRVTVAWQGLTPLNAPPAAITCGANAYNSADAGSPCVNDLCRRYVTTVVRFAALNVNPPTGTNTNPPPVAPP